LCSYCAEKYKENRFPLFPYSKCTAVMVLLKVVLEELKHCEKGSHHGM